MSIGKPEEADSDEGVLTDEEETVIPETQESYSQQVNRTNSEDGTKNENEPKVLKGN